MAYTAIPHHCKTCNETNPRKFYGDRKRVCMKCRREQVLEKYRAKRINAAAMASVK
jgi:hypothetical protein